MEPDKKLSVLNKPLEECGTNPMTGFFRDGHCNTCSADHGSHTVCAIMTDEFLAFSKYLGNDLTTPRPEYNFTGLKAGNSWCLCAARFLQAHEEECAPQVRLAATHIRSLEIIPLEILKKYRSDIVSS